MRDLVRDRDDAVVVGTQAKYRLKAFLRRQGRRYPRTGWMDHSVLPMARRSQFPDGRAARGAPGIPNLQLRDQAEGAVCSAVAGSGR